MQLVEHILGVLPALAFAACIFVPFVALVWVLDRFVWATELNQAWAHIRSEAIIGFNGSYLDARKHASKVVAEMKREIGGSTKALNIYRQYKDAQIELAKRHNLPVPTF